MSLGNNCGCFWWSQNWSREYSHLLMKSRLLLSYQGCGIPEMILQAVCVYLSLSLLLPQHQPFQKATWSFSLSLSLGVLGIIPSLRLSRCCLAGWLDDDDGSSSSSFGTHSHIAPETRFRDCECVGPKSHRHISPRVALSESLSPTTEHVPDTHARAQNDKTSLGRHVSHQKSDVKWKILGGKI